MEDKRKSKPLTKVLIMTGIFVALIITFTIIMMPYINKLAEPEYQAQFKQWVDSMGFVGFLVVFLVQMLQIIVAFIPGEPIEVIAGILYGTWGGLAVCLLGCVVASTIVFLLSRRFGTPLLHKFFGKKSIDDFYFLRDSRRIETIAFILFLIPGTPKDMLTYVAGISKIKLSRFLIIATFARIPSVLTSTMAGAHMSRGRWGISLLIFALTGIIGILGIKFKDRMINYCKKIGSQVKRKKEIL